MKTVPALVAAVALAAVLATPAHAGRSCETQKLTTQAVERGMTLAERTHRALEAEYERRGTRVVVLARAGQDLTKWNLRWSHLGWAYREERDGVASWRIVHKLNQCGSAEASLYRQGLGEFFLDDLWRAEAAYAMPTAALQDALWPVLRDDVRATAMHQRAYNLVSYPWSLRYQQSNQWAIEMLAATQVPAPANRERAQAWLKVQGYEPSVLRIGPLTRLGGRLTAANVAFDDHPNEKRYSDRIETVTVDSVFTWMRRSGLAGDTVTLRAE